LPNIEPDGGRPFHTAVVYAKRMLYELPEDVRTPPGRAVPCVTDDEAAFAEESPDRR
jgi:hypothetical protein